MTAPEEYPVRTNRPHDTSVDDVFAAPVPAVMAEHHVANVNGVDLVKVKRVSREVEKDLVLAVVFIAWVATIVVAVTVVAR